MLSPVPAVENVSIAASSGSKAAVVAENLTQLGSAQTVAAVLNNQDATSEIKGRIGILLISARERMIDSLFAAIDAAGKAAVVTPLPGESRVSYAARVADKINALPPETLSAAERDWNQQGQTVALKMIAAALKNPTGAEAAAVIAYLETARYKDRDLATRAVMRSYRQNDGSSFKSVAVDMDTSVPTKAVGIFDETGELPKNPSSAQQVSASRVAISAQALQTSARPTAENADYVTAAAVDDTAGLVISEQKDHAENTVSPRSMLEAEIQSSEVEAGLGIPDNWTNVIGTINSETTELLLAVIGEENVQPLLSEAADEVQAEGQAAIADQIEEPIAGAIEKNADSVMSDVRMAAASTIEEAEAPIQQNAARDGKLPAFPQAQAVAAYVQQQGVAIAKMASGIGLSAVPYDFDKDDADAGETTLGYRTHYTDQDGGGQPREQHNRSRDDHAGEEGETASSQSADPAQDGQTEQPATEPAFDLYRRMAGW